MKQGIKAFIGCLLLVVLDQFTKVLALQNLKGQEPITIIPDVFQLLYVENRGAAFGILQNKQWVFLIITAIVLAALIWALPRMSRERHFLPLRLCLCFIGAGAVGNMIDRIFRGYVVDFFYFKLIDFPVFNVADIYVTTSAIVLIFLIVFLYKEEDFDRLFSKKGR
ncbi:signal peptidase II [Eubacterium sp. An3]|uniref:signal peptidase II n=1 Tax=Eubacterium sp. An3 TaxID=1965628 RepID=UPI0007A91C1A|nr:signal peptidase II [Eubacterium sp. An3]OUO26671.1 signal peptidase II [Eubacterium sp. An3]CVI66758.1 Lipoprotein signal peptidase [Eubacteriaceae bacterium CHKCI004]